MPHLDVTYNGQTGRLDLKAPDLRHMLIRHNNVHQSGSQQEPVVPTRHMLAAADMCWMRPKDAKKKINAMHLEPGQGHEKEKPQWSRRQAAQRAKTDWHFKRELLKEFREDLLKLKKPTRRVLLPPPGATPEEVTHHIRFHQMDDRRSRCGWRPQKEPRLDCIHEA